MGRVLVCLWFLVAPLRAQVPEPVPELPGAGRAVDIQATGARRARLLERIGNGVILVPAAEQRDLERHVVQDNDFRQDDYFFYLTGVETPNAWLLLVASTEGDDQVTLFLPKRDPQQERWTGLRLGPGDDAVRLTGIPRVVSLDLDSLERAAGVAALRLGVPLYAVMYPGTRDNERIRRWSMSGRDVRNIVPVLDSMRLVKDSAEVAALGRAIQVTTEAQKAAMRNARPGMFEYQLEAVVEFTFRHLGADRMGFPSIIGSGPNSTTLHYDVNRRRLQSGDLVVVDIGAEYAQYTADVTRTFPANGRFTPRQKAIYDLVLATQQAAIDAVRPGVTVAELNRIARRYMQEHSGELCGEQDCNRYFVHGLSHWLGMRVHDVGDYRTPLEPGMVLTIEPGIYLPEENLGVRIEDDILVTDTGNEILSAAAPRTTEDIERLMAAPDRAAGSIR